MRKRCKECGRRISGWWGGVSGYCRRCYEEIFAPPKGNWPVLRRKVKGGWQKLLSPSERASSQAWIDEIIERIDRAEGGEGE